MANKQYYLDNLAKASQSELKSWVDYANQDDDLSEEDIQEIKDEAEEHFTAFCEAKADRDLDIYGDNYLTDDELGLTQI